jgi:hypothetical protein
MLRAQLDQMTRERDALRQQGGTGSAAAPSTPRTRALEAEVAALQKQNAGLQAAIRQTPRAAPPTPPPSSAPQPPAAQAGDLARCEAANAKLLQTGHDILHLYETQDFRELLWKSYEPLLGLWRVKLENIVQDYDERLQDHLFYPKAGRP